MRKIVGIGESVLDILFRDAQPIAAVPGGSTFNSMISLGRTAGRLLEDVKVMIVTQLGRDQVSEIITSFIKRNGVSDEAVSLIDGIQTPVSIAMLDEKNDAHYEFFRDKEAPALVARDIDFAPGDIVIFGSFFAIKEGTRDAVRQIVLKAKAAGAIIYYDINFRKSHLLDLPVTRPFIEENCALSDIVRGSCEDIELVFGSADPHLVYQQKMSSLCSTFVCTKGSKSAEVFSIAGSWEFPVEKIDTVSTIGAGDNFNAGLVYGLGSGKYEKDKVHCLDLSDWKHLVPVAMRFSANVCRSIFNYVDEDFYKTL